MRAVGVAAGTAAPKGAAVDFVEEVMVMGYRVEEGGRVDGAALTVELMVLVNVDGCGDGCRDRGEVLL